MGKVVICKGERISLDVGEIDGQGEGEMLASSRLFQ